MPDVVPYLAKEVIEDEARYLLTEFGREYDRVLEPPVPIDEIVELHLKLTFEIRNLQQLFGVGDVHGAIWFKERRIVIDEHLDPELYPARLGRYHFTLAHEAGHWCLHRELFLQRGSLESTVGRPDYICRSSDKNPLEWQADYFAAQLLMPNNLIWPAWKAWHGSSDPLAFADLADQAETLLEAELQRRGCDRYSKNSATDMIFENYCRPLAERFQVSAAALRIRLEDMGLLLREQESRLC